MKIIIRSTGERTENECFRLAKRHGAPAIIRAYPFGESIRQTYEMADTFKQKWTPVIDADVLLHDGTIKQAIHDLDQKDDNIFCLDGKTNDKILMKNRRAGVHIYRTEMMLDAVKYIDSGHVKPESNVRKKMQRDGYPTYVPKNIIFGLHDYEQYYRDLWRKSVCQTQKLAGMTGKRPAKWRKMSRRDKDYLVIFHAHNYGKKNVDNIVIDARIDYGAAENLKRLGIREKGELGK